MKTLLGTIAVASFGFAVQTATPAAPSAVYTAEQAAAGRLELSNNAFGACTDCHTTTLTGRNGDAGELPPFGSLPDGLQKTIRSSGGKVPALAGPKFMARWGARSTKHLNADMQRRFNVLSEETQLNIAAYILQANGAQPGTQALTRATDVEIGSIATGIAPPVDRAPTRGTR